jgi:uncharacterized protein (DUF2164 family)
MSEITFSSREKEQLVAKLKKYFESELDFEIGQFDCEFLLDFISSEFGAHYYNKGLVDAQTILAAKLDDINHAIYEIEQPTKF